jgi:hypothetical protein
MSYDIIGDIHGQADKLEALLRKLGYVERSGCWGHPGRAAVFVGDFVDRGPAQLRAVTMDRRMVEDGKAQSVMGNHEFNASAWHTPDPENPGDYLRPHFSERWGEKNRHRHVRFLAEVENDAACVDYSAGKDGPLVAYRWDGESRLSDRNLVTTDDGRRL